VTSIDFSVDGMSCQHCKKAIEMALQTLDGVKEAVVDLEKKSVHIEFDAQATNEQQIKDTIQEAGYVVR